MFAFETFCAPLSPKLSIPPSCDQVKICKNKNDIKEMHPGIEFSPCSTELGHEEVSVPFVYQMCELKRLIIRQLKKAAKWNANSKWFRLSLAWLKAGCLAVSHWMYSLSKDWDEAPLCDIIMQQKLQQHNKRSSAVTLTVSITTHIIDYMDFQHIFQYMTQIINITEASLLPYLFISLW